MVVRVGAGASLRGRLRASTVSSGATFPLDGLPTPQFAYSLNRRLLTSFAGSSLIQVQELGGNTTSNIAMVNNETNASAIASFGGVSVTKNISVIRNQGSTGASGDAIGALAAQHQIYDGGTQTLRTMAGAGKLALDGVGVGGYSIGTWSDATMVTGSTASTVQGSFVGVFNSRSFRGMWLLSGADANIQLFSANTSNNPPYGNFCGTFPDGNMWLGEVPATTGAACAGYRDGNNGEFRQSGSGNPVGTPQRTTMTQYALAASQAYTILGQGSEGWGSTEVDFWSEFVWWNTRLSNAQLNAYISNAKTYYGI